MGPPLAGWRHARSGGWDAYTSWSRSGSHDTLLTLNGNARYVSFSTAPACLGLR